MLGGSIPQQILFNDLIIFHTSTPTTVLSYFPHLFNDTDFISFTSNAQPFWVILAHLTQMFQRVCLNVCSFLLLSINRIDGTFN